MEEALSLVLQRSCQETAGFTWSQVTDLLASHSAGSESTASTTQGSAGSQCQSTKGTDGEPVGVALWYESVHDSL